MKRALFRIICASVVLFLAACGPPNRGRHFENSTVPPGVQYLGKIWTWNIFESSGVAASPHYPGVFWTHNDGGGKNYDVLFAIKRDGSYIGRWKVTGSRLADWEDITVDAHGDLLIGDIGDNHFQRRHIMVHRIKEPDPGKGSGTVPIEQTWILTYPKGPRNTEAMFTLGTNCYLITKRAPEPTEVYRFALSTNKEPQTLELIAELDIATPVAGAALSPDARTLALVAAAGAFAYRIDGDVERLRGLAPCHLTKFPNLRIEGCTFVPEGLLATSETRHVYLFTNEVFRPGN
jgi:hypothetical protein